jgi:hypothetical protein
VRLWVWAEGRAIHPFTHRLLRRPLHQPRFLQYFHYGQWAACGSFSAGPLPTRTRRVQPASALICMPSKCGLLLWIRESANKDQVAHQTCGKAPCRTIMVLVGYAAWSRIIAR